MIFCDKQIPLKNGKTALLRAPRMEDAAEMIAFLKTVCTQTPYLLRAPEECTETPRMEASFLENLNDSPDGLMIVCEIEGRIAGNCMLTLGRHKKNAHRASVAISVLQEFWGLGVGSAMFAAMETVANACGLRFMELEVMAGNTRAIGLYQKMGFVEFARRPEAFLMPDGSYMDEVMMLKQL